MNQWKYQDETNLKYVGSLEFQDNWGEYHNFEVYNNDTVIVFGCHTNCGLLQSGYMILDSDFSLDENLQELLSDLETYYNFGKDCTNKIICNDRM